MYAYIVSILLEFGYTEVQCGYVTMLQYLIVLIAGPFYGQIIDRYLSPKKLFIILLIGGMAVTPFLSMAFHSSFALTLIMVALITLLDFSGCNVLDTWITMMIRKDDSIDYGVIRSAGSVFYACTALVSGYLIAPLGMDILFILHFALMGVAVLLALRNEDPAKLPDLSELNAKDLPSAGPISLRASLTVLFSNREYVIFLVATTLYYFATRSVNTYMQVVLNAVGGDVSSYGLSVFLYCVGECLMMQYASRLLRRGLKMELLFIISLSAMAVRILLLALLHDMLWIMVTQVFLSIGFGCFLRFNIEYAAGLFPPEYSGRAILVSVAVTQGFGCITGNLLGGYLIEGSGVQNYLFLCSALLLAALAVFLLGQTHQNKLTKQEN